MMTACDAPDPLAALWDAVEADRAEAVDRAVRVALPSLLPALRARAKVEGEAVVEVITTNPKRANSVKGAVRKAWRDLGLDQEAL